MGSMKVRRGRADACAGMGRAALRLWQGPRQGEIAGEKHDGSQARLNTLRGPAGHHKDSQRAQGTQPWAKDSLACAVDLTEDLTGGVGLQSSCHLSVRAPPPPCRAPGQSLSWRQPSPVAGPPSCVLRGFVLWSLVTGALELRVPSPLPACCAQGGAPGTLREGKAQTHLGPSRCWCQGGPRAVVAWAGTPPSALAGGARGQGCVLRDPGAGGAGAGLTGPPSGLTLQSIRLPRQHRQTDSRVVGGDRQG